MTRTDAEQHAAVWRLAGKILLTDWERQKPSTELVAATLAISNLAEAVARSYDVLGKAINKCDS